MYLHLDRLKARILPPELATGTNGDRLDARLGPLAAGIADLFDAECGRSFLRLENAVDAFPGGAALVKLARYPVESVASVTLTSPDGTVTDITDDIARLSRMAGLLHFVFPPGTEDDEIEVTYTGGCWVDLSAEGDGALPVGAVALPRDLIDAWVLQCDHEARARKILGTAPQGGTGAKDVASLGEDYDIVPRVARTLRQYARIC